MRTQLLPHNKAAYQKVIKAFEAADRTCVVHPTGTGKSYLIAAVSESYKNVLILGPNTFVLNQVHSVLEWRDRQKDGKVEYMTYSLLMFTENPQTNYDLICIDEFHRAGAPEWGDAVDRLLEANPSAKILGTSATPIRFLDDNRDMADELFGGNIASYMTLKDAWNMDILATPRFVTGLFEFDKVAGEALERISKSRRLDDNEKKVRLTRINNLRLDWERSQGMPAIIGKHIGKDARRIIVFCGNIEHLKEMEGTVKGWFLKAGIRVASVSTVYGYMPDKEIQEAMEEFERDDIGAEGVKLMLSVNMLNEGVHIPRVNAVILLRTTSSKIIYLQQIGRCLTAAKTDKPVILDMVDNITMTNLVHDIRDGFDWFEHQKMEHEEVKSANPRDFIVYDYTLGIQQAIEKLVPHNEVKKMPFEERLSIVRDFCEKSRRLPTRKDDKDVFMSWLSLRHYHGDSPEVIELKERYGAKKKTFDERLEMLERFIEKNDCLPVLKHNHDDYQNYMVLNYLHKKNPDERFQAIRDKYMTKKKEPDDVLLQRFMDFVNENQRLPFCCSGRPKYEINLRRNIRERLMDNPLVIAMFEKYGAAKAPAFEERLARLQRFIEAYGRLPHRKDEEKEEYANLANLRRLNKRRNDSRVNEINDRFSVTYTDEQVKQRVLDFFAKHGRLMRKGVSNEEAALDKLLRDHKDVLYKDPDIIPLLKTRKKQISLDERVRMLEEYTAEHGHRPDPEDKYMYNMWIRTITQSKEKDPRVKKLYERYGGNPASRMSEYVAPLSEFIFREHRLPLNKEEKRLYSILVNIRMRYSDHPAVRPILEEIDSWPKANVKRQMANDEEFKHKIIDFVDANHRLPKFNKKKEEEYKLAAQWNGRRDRICMDDPVMQAILDKYDRRPLKFGDRYKLVRDWALEHGRLPTAKDGDIYQKYETLNRSYIHTPEVQALRKKYVASESKRRVNIDDRLDQIEAFAEVHNRLPSTAHSDEMKLGRWWVNIKRRNGSYQRVTALKERFPIQNRM